MVLKDPDVLQENVYNMDETGIMLSKLNSVKVLVGKDNKRGYRGARVKRTTIIAIECVPNNERNRERKQRLQQKHTSATQLSFAERALLQEHNRFLAQINNEAKPRRSTKSDVLGTAKVMSYEDLEKAKAERAAKETAKETAKEVKKAKREAKKAEKEAKKLRKRQRKLPRARVHVTGSASVLW
ncbi:hypothetical protein K432DRAFT_409922 [Lepidopterella palustris CBS 459.81]|uniref:Uncharacterized protein n=1 Tax=Lepidopterella palustris CBS 459.81 TaxID=1314670 RepID=A0A8E2DZ82_9PEZI|nr:hypothetical protein K432DRAFT_409922 [Lepidopterella palustris CBS 459.81]